VGISTIACFDQHDVQAFLKHRIVEEEIGNFFASCR
jgi:hypothetical protein